MKWAPSPSPAFLEVVTCTLWDRNGGAGPRGEFLPERPVPSALGRHRFPALPWCAVQPLRWLGVIVLPSRSPEAESLGIGPKFNFSILYTPQRQSPSIVF